uniref:Candidate secreted effector n=1 Tax=Meloidogyne incognita TaxID=6306 RepID=A0A914L1U7_MELIC
MTFLHFNKQHYLHNFNNKDSNNLHNNNRSIINNNHLTDNHFYNLLFDKKLAQLSTTIINRN